MKTKKSESDKKLLRKIIGYDWNNFDIYLLSKLADRIEMLGDKDIYTSQLDRIQGAKVLRNLSEILKEKYETKEDEEINTTLKYLIDNNNILELVRGHPAEILITDKFQTLIGKRRLLNY